MTREEYKETLAAYALGALETDEARELAALLAEDSSLRAEFEELREAAAALTFAAEPLEPSPDVRARILEKIKQTPQNARPKFTVIEGGDKRASSKNVVAFEPKTTETILSRRSFWSYAPTLVAVAASLAVLILAVSLYNALRQNEAKNLQISELNQRINEAGQKLEKTSNDLAQIRAERELLGSPTTIVASLKGTENSPQARARLVFDKQTGRAFLFVEGLPDAPQGKAYQIWWISDPTKPAPGGTFKTGSGKGELRDRIPPKDLNAGVFAVTLEPEGGSQAPTGKPYLISKL